MANETKTTFLTREILRDLNYYDDENITVEEQRSDNKSISSLLSKASKAETKQRGMPEFIIWENKKDVLIIIECKASTQNHESEKHDNPKKYAVDGVLHYARFLKHKYNIVSIAISGRRYKRTKNICVFLE